MRAASIVTALFALLPQAGFAIESHPPEAALADVRKIFVEQLGGGKTSDQFRDMLIAAIQNSGLFSLTESQDRADATLKGSGDDVIFTELHSTNDSIGVHANSAGGSSSRAMNSGESSNSSMGIGVTDSESSRIQDRRHEATGSVRLVGRDGDIIWSTTQESAGGKFRGAMADVADKIMRQLTEQTRKMRDLAALHRDARSPVQAVTPSVAAPDAASTAPAEDADGPHHLTRQAHAGE